MWGAARNLGLLDERRVENGEGTKAKAKNHE